MALIRIDLSGSLCIEKKCTEVIFNDTTGIKYTPCTCDRNSQGYGLTGGIELNDVTSANLNIYFPGITTPIVFDFTILTSVIVAATLTDLNSNVTDILSLLESTEFPLTNFNVTRDYGAILPEISDGLFTWDYTITGVTIIEGFYYTTSGEKLSGCKNDCCISNSYVDLDLSCGCLDDKLDKILKSEVFMQAAYYATDMRENTKAIAFLNLSKDICESNCKNC